MPAFLKGNYTVKNKPDNQASSSVETSNSENLERELKERALASLGGSMVYVDRTELEWDGELEED